MDIKLTSAILLEISIPDVDAEKAPRVYQLSVPSWASYEECKSVCDAFKTGFDEMKVKNQAALEKLKAEQESSSVAPSAESSVDSQPQSE